MDVVESTNLRCQCSPERGNGRDLKDVHSYRAATVKVCVALRGKKYSR